MIKFTDEQKKFIFDNYKGIGNKELICLFNEKFGTCLNNEIKYFKRNHHLSSGITGRFKKGHIPHNKGKKWDDYMSKESQIKCRNKTFKKGNIPLNRKEIFDERINKNGYIEIKVQDKKQTHNWKLKHRYIYECKYGVIPKGYKVIFLDGNKNNFDIDNLKMITNAEEFIMNTHKLRYRNKDLTETGYLVAKVLYKSGQKKNDRL